MNERAALDAGAPTWEPGRPVVLVPECGHPRLVRWAVADGAVLALNARPRLTVCRRKTCPSLGQPQRIADAMGAPA